MTPPVTREDREAVYLLARTVYAWIPAPRSSRRQNGAAGFASGRDEKGQLLRWLSCPDCLTNDGARRAGCETCGGRGEIPDDVRDPYERPGTPFFGDEQQRRRDQAVERDAAIARLERDWGANAGAESTDPLDAAVDRAEGHYRRGSYRQFLRALRTVEQVSERRARSLVRLVVNGEENLIRVEPWTRSWLDQTVDWVAMLMPRPIELPADAHRDLEAWKYTLQHGKSPQHRAAREERNVEIVRLVVEHGWSLRRAGRVYGVSHETVRKILAEAGDQAAVATGPAV